MAKLIIRHQIGLVVNAGDDSWLVLKRNPAHYDGWGLIQGGINAGEHFLDTVIRETKEEIGVGIEKEAIQNLGYISAHQDEANNRAAVVSWFTTKLSREVLENLTLQDDEWVDSKIVMLDQALEVLAHESQKAALKKSCDLLK